MKEVREVERRVDIGREETAPVLEVVPRHYRELQDIAKIVDSNGGYHDYALYNVDLRFGQRYCLKHAIFPFGLLWYSNGRWRAEEEQFALDYPIPPLRPALLDLRVDAPLGIPRFQDKLLSARVGDIEVGGSESEILEKLGAAVKKLDPDVILTDNGDAFLMSYLARKAAEHTVPLQLGRDPDRFVERRGKSYFTYGKIVYKPGQYLLKGRLHLDRWETEEGQKRSRLRVVAETIRFLPKGPVGGTEEEGAPGGGEAPAASVAPSNAAQS